MSSFITSSGALLRGLSTSAINKKVGKKQLGGGRRNLLKLPFPFRPTINNIHKNYKIKNSQSTKN